jgi:hypothetical protein
LSGITLCGAALVVAVSLYLLGRLGLRDVGAYAAVGATFLIAAVAPSLKDAVTSLLPLADGVGEDALVSVTKALSLGYLTGLCADLCEDLGQTGVSRALIFGGRAMIFSLSVPYFVRLVEFARGLLS